MTRGVGRLFSKSSGSSNLIRTKICLLGNSVEGAKRANHYARLVAQKNPDR